MRHFLLVLLAALPLLAGCGGNSKTARVSGIVTLDGQPVAKAGIAFRPEDGSRLSTGETDEQGKFTLTCYEDEDGASPGAHTVTVTKFEQGKAKIPAGVDAATAEMMMQDGALKMPKKKWIVPEKYSNPKESGLTFTVEKGKNTANFDLKSN